MQAISSLIDTISTLSTSQNSSILWLSITLLAFIAGQKLYKVANYNPLLSPTITAVVLLILLLVVSGVPYEKYFEGASMIHFLLGPATVSLAVPLYEQRTRLAKLWLPLSVGLITGCFAAIFAVVVIGQLVGLSQATLMSMVPKSVTTPIAMGVSENIGGMPGLTAALVVITGIFGGIIGRPLFRILKIRSDSTRGVTLGLSAHGMGTSTAFQISNKAGAFSGLAMGMAGVITAFMAPAVAIPLYEWIQTIIKP